MSVKGFKNHPYIPNSVPEVEQEMLHELGLNSLEELHAEVPDEIILKREMDLPEAFGSEYELRRHVEGVLKKNKTCADNLNFLGAGCWQHYVPALCDEINGKGEFVTAYGGEVFGRYENGGTCLFYVSSVPFRHIEAALLNQNGIGPGKPSLRPAGVSMERENAMTHLLLGAPVFGVGLAALRLWRDRQRERS